jgi:hypothetical protein
MDMDLYLAAVWGSVIFGMLAVICLGAWFATGRQSAALRVMGGFGALAAALSYGYMTYMA